MTKEDAIKTLKELWRETHDSWYEEVYKMAIDALKADRKTEPQTSGTPYKIETSSVCKTEPFDTDINVRCKTEPQTCRNNEADCKYSDNCNPTVCFKARDEFAEAIKDEPQTERSE